MCSASQPSSRAITDAIRNARHFLPSRALPPYPEPYDQISRVSGKCTIHFSSGLQGHTEVGLSLGEGRPERVQARHEVAVVAEDVEGALPGTGHDDHRGGHVRRVGDLHPDVGQPGPERPHAERDDVHGPAPHAAPEQGPQRGPHLVGIHPVVRRAGVGLALGADEGAVLDPGHVARVAAGPVGAGPAGRVELDEGAGLDEGPAQLLVLGLGAVAPVDGGGLAEVGDVPDPRHQACVPGRRVLVGCHDQLLGCEPGTGILTVGLPGT